MFNKDFQMGSRYERLALKYMAKLFSDDASVELPPPGPFKPWDFKFNGTAYEVKSDRYAKYPERMLCIEYECFGNDSGISTTEATDYFYFKEFNTKVYEGFRIPVARIRDYIKEHPDVVKKSGGDGGASKFYLLPCSAFDDCSITQDLLAKHLI